MAALTRWSHSLSNFWPEEFSDSDLVYFKAPVLDRLVNPPTTSTSIQRKFIRSMKVGWAIVVSITILQSFLILLTGNQ